MGDGADSGNYGSAWKFYGIQRDDIAAIRTHFLLRIMVVDSEPFQNLIDGGLNPDLHWERRYFVIQLGVIYPRLTLLSGWSLPIGFHVLSQMLPALPFTLMDDSGGLALERYSPVSSVCYGKTPT